MPTATPKKPASTPRRKAPAGAVGIDPAVDTGEAAPTGGGTALRLKELVERVTASTGGKKKGVKEIVEATLTQLGLALQKGEMLNLPEFGKVRVAKAQGSGPGSAMTLKLRRGNEGGKKKPAENAAEQTLAEPADQG